MKTRIEPLLKQAEQVYQENFPPETWFERCIFVNWYCSLGNCTFCYRSTQKDKITNPSISKVTAILKNTQSPLSVNLFTCDITEM